jgi:hypothetical protein
MTRGIRLAAKILSITLVAGLALSAFLWVGYTKLKGYSSNPLTYSSCITETEAKFEDIAGWDFEAEDTSCDTLAKDEEVRVFAVSSQAKNSRLGKLFARRRLIFAYDPGTAGVDGLIVRAKDAKHILISLPSASSVFEKNRTLGEKAIDYDIRRIDYP